MYIKSLQCYGRDGLEIIYCRRIEPGKCIDYRSLYISYDEYRFCICMNTESDSALENCDLN